MHKAIQKKLADISGQLAEELSNWVGKNEVNPTDSSHALSQSLMKLIDLKKHTKRLFYGTTGRDINDLLGAFIKMISNNGFKEPNKDIFKTWINIEQKIKRYLSTITTVAA